MQETNRVITHNLKRESHRIYILCLPKMIIQGKPVLEVEHPKVFEVFRTISYISFNYLINPTHIIYSYILIYNISIKQ